MIYCDASLVVALVTPEGHSEAAEQWFRAQPPASFAASDWVLTEVGSALALKHRLGQLDATAHAASWQAARRLLAGFTAIAVEPRHFKTAAERFVATPPRGLRAGDALHLAIVFSRGCDLATLDRDLRAAARAMGIEAATIAG